MTLEEQVLGAMKKLHDRDHSILGALLLYLHQHTQDRAERAAVVNHAFDAAMHLAMLVCKTEDRAEMKKEILGRLAQFDVSKMPSTKQLADENAIQGLFNEGMMRISSDKKFMSLLATLSAVGKPGVNDILH